MSNKIGRRIWWWVLPAVVVLGGLGYYWYSQTGPEPAKVLVAGDLSPVDKKAPSQGGSGIKDLEREGPDAGDIAERPAGDKSFPIDKKALPKKPLRREPVPVEKEVLLQELRAATEDQIERISELGKEDFVKMDKRIKPLFEPGREDSIRTDGEPQRLAESGKDNLFRAGGRVERQPELGKDDAIRTDGEPQRLVESGKDNLFRTGGEVERQSELAKDDLAGTDEGVTRLFEPRKEDVFRKAPADKIYCDLIDEYVADFFAYLNTKKYIKRLDLKTDSYTYFKRIIKTLAARPPMPAGEGFAPTIMVKNVFFFSRALDRKDLRLFKEVAISERDTLEMNLEMFYRWIMLGKLCPNPGQVRPLFDVMYRYAGFFLNTTGGRAYLFRRSTTLRLLLTYYSVLVVYQADRSGKNSYGINIFPSIQPLKNEISHYPDFEFQNQYVNTLTRIEDYYLRKR